jgi:hypothetical protein
MENREDIKVQKFLIHDEGEKLKAYPCTKNKWTIGIGRNLEGNPLTYEERSKLYDSDQEYFDSINIDRKSIHEWLEDNFDYFINRGITKEFSRYLFLNDIQKITPFLNTLLLPNDFSYVRRCVLINMIFAMGETGFLCFKNFIKALRIADYGLAAREMLDSAWGRSKVKGEADRIKRLSLIMREDKFPEWMDE